MTDKTKDNVNHPAHYTSHPSGVECITIARHYCFSIGSAIKYLWRAGLKEDADKTPREKEIEDLEKAVWFIHDRIKELKGMGELTMGATSERKVVEENLAKLADRKKRNAGRLRRKWRRIGEFGVTDKIGLIRIMTEEEKKHEFIP